MDPNAGATGSKLRSSAFAPFVPMVALSSPALSGPSSLASRGGIWNQGTMTLMNSTVSGNTPRGIFILEGTLTLMNSVVDGACDGDPVTSNGHDIESPGNTCGFAIDVIPEAACLDADGEPLTEDQRGEPRPGGSMCDVGAFEVQP